MEEKILIKGIFNVSYIAEFFRILSLAYGVIFGLISLCLFAVHIALGLVSLAITAFVSGLVALAAYLYKKYASQTLTVTNIKVYGKTPFLDHVEIPIKQISTITYAKKRLTVSSSSGIIHFNYLENCQKITRIITDLIGKSQEPYNQNTIQNNADELKKYKDLFDSGIITQEEFDAKKKQLLGL